MSQQTGVRDQVLAIVAKRWPCMEVPRGGLSELAAEVGVSRERVRQIVRAEGIGKRLKGPPPPRPCKWCGLPVLRKNYRYCAACSAIPCICETCGKAFTTNVTRIKHLQRDA